VHVLLEALSAAGDPPFKIVGDGPQAGQLRGDASRLRLKHTTFVGRAPSDEVDRLLREARFVALPSIWNENAPLAALEAVARGRPLIVSSIGGLPELAAESRGWTARPGDAQDLADKIRIAMADDGMCTRAGEAALAFARKELTPKRHLTLLERTYEELIT
jgi:glycosyltransferase involved in cell wall biosynthesis